MCMPSITGSIPLFNGAVQDRIENATFDVKGALLFTVVSLTVIALHIAWYVAYL